ncbi:hypothetical protein B0H16DRAFT_320242 [Mycena metata]|uniref:Uncharacterized protein n=1 Tax=Mycena metata TaxID=1033252 RepID=A0AAD7HNI6_9AGAR|nr:hypothetical protein B0H16DRAFT_320242 [Mycena metata]
MRTSTIFAALLTMAVASYAAPLEPTARSTIHDLKSFRTASHADQQAFLLALDPKTWNFTDAELARIAKQPRVLRSTGTK